MDFKVKTFDELTAREIYNILRAREEIFTHEKRMSCHDIDGKDLACLHCMLTEGDELLAYLRAEKTDMGAKIGRVITLTHGKGHGKILMESSVPAVSNFFGTDTIEVHAQYDAIGFYNKMGFLPVSDEFIEEGVRHIAMIKKVLLGG